MVDIYTQILRLLIASIVGIIIGFERTKRGKSAGVATFSIICVTSCLLTLISCYGFISFEDVNTDPSRLISNIITAIGFVAGGVIFTIKDNNSTTKVTGITTGAIIFCVASLGIAIGLGLYELVLTIVCIIEFNIYIAIKIKKYCNKCRKKQLEEDDENDSTDI